MCRMKKKEFILISFATMLAMLAIWYVWKLKKGKCVCLTGDIDQNKILELGSQGQEVLVLQKWINCHSGQSIQQDGLFGPQTEAALRALLLRKQISFDENSVFVMLSDLNINPCNK